MGDELWMQVASVFIPLFGYILVIMIIGTLIDYISSLFGFSRNWGINLISYNMLCHSGFAYKQEQSKSLKEIRNLKVIFSDTVIITVLFFLTCIRVLFFALLFIFTQTVIFCRFLRVGRKQKIPISLGNQDFTVFCFSSKWCHQESNNTIQSPNLQHFNIFGKIPEPLNQPYAKFTNFR